MKKLTCILHTLIFSSAFSVEPKSLKQSAIDQLLRFSQFTSEQKLKFNKDLQPITYLLNPNDGTLDWANLAGITLKNENFQGIHFNGTNFYQAKFINCKFQGATFQNVNFREADFSESELEGVCFKGAKLQGATLATGLKLPYYFKTAEIFKYYSDNKDPQIRKTLNKIIGTRSFSFSAQDLSNLDLQNIQFKNCSLYGVDLTGSDLTDAEFENSSLDQVNLSFVKLSKDSTLSESCSLFTLLTLFNKPETTLDQKQAIHKLFKPDIDLTLDKTANDLKGVDLTGAYLKNVTFKKGQLSGAIFNDWVIPDHKDDEDLIHQYIHCQDPEKKEKLLQLLNSIQLKLVGANLKGLNLKKIDLTNVYLADAQLQKATLFDGFEIPDYNTPEDLLKRYGDSTSQKEKDALNKLFTLYGSCFSFRYSNLSGLNLQELNLSKLYFYKVDFTNTDFTNALLSKGNIQECHFSNATLPNGFKMPTYQNNRELVQRYSDSKDEEFKRNLNAFFDLHPLNLEHKDLRNLNLQGLNLKNACLDDVQLQGTLLFEGFKVPDYKRTSDLIKVYAQNKDPKIRQNLNKLFDHIYLDTKHIDSTIPLSQEEKDFTHLDLVGINLSRSRNLKELDFRGCNFTNANITPSTINPSSTQWSKDFILPDDLSKESMKTFYQHMNKTDKNIFLFLQVCQAQRLSTNLAEYENNAPDLKRKRSDDDPPSQDKKVIRSE